MVTDDEGGEKELEHAIRIWEINEDRLRLMQHKLSDTPKLLSVAAGRETCSIFKVPQSLTDFNGKSYQPHIVSIGPYHHGLPHLQMIEEHKWRYLHQLLNRTQINGMLLEHYLRAVQPLEFAARECYSEGITYSSDEFIEMMVLDGCFIIELFRKYGEMIQTDMFDPLVTTLWILSFLSRDLIKLENQIPFFVLERLFDLTKMPSDESSSTLATLALEFFNYILQRPDDILEKHANIKANHLLDLLRSSYLPPERVEPTKIVYCPPPHIIHSISKLHRAGIKLKPSDAESFLVVNFKKGTIHMPTIAIDDFMCAFLLNSVAFEQCHSGCSKHFTAYVTLLDCLINTPIDVGYLCDRSIIENNLGTDEDVASLVNTMGKDSFFNIDLCYLAKIFYDVNRHYHNDWHVQLASWRDTYLTYFDAPWSFISALAAFILLVLTVVQTVYTVVGYVRAK